MNEKEKYEMYVSSRATYINSSLLQANNGANKDAGPCGASVLSQKSGRYVIDVIAQIKSTCAEAEANQNGLHRDQIQNLHIEDNSGSRAFCIPPKNDQGGLGAPIL